MRFVRYSLLIAAFAATSLAAQRPDSMRVVPTPVVRSIGDSLRSPLTPRKAFLYGFLAPGYSQSVLGRHKAASAFLLVEAISLAMIRESAADLHEARRFENDSLVISYGSDGIPIKAPGRFGNTEVRTRKAHVEDWIALLVANHLFSGADGFVAANLWDVKAKLALRATPGGASIGASIDVW
ncbi:MAG TPA: hypothetical protein VGM82_19300 [Gemmatimonadaceae bacterium]|jgi:hypothetical protein